MPGDYVAGIAVTTHDLKKIGTQYYEFKLPEPSTVAKTLDTTPLFFVKDLKNIGQAEQRPPSSTRACSGIPSSKSSRTSTRSLPRGDVLDVFFTILGTQASPENKYSIEVVYEVTKGEEPAISSEPAIYRSSARQPPAPAEADRPDQDRRPDTAGNARPAPRHLHAPPQDHRQDFRKRLRQAIRFHGQVSRIEPGFFKGGQLVPGRAAAFFLGGKRPARQFLG